MAITSRTIKFTASTTTHVTNFNVYGSSGKPMTLKSITDGTFFTLIKDGGGVVRTCDFLTVQDCHVSGANTWYAGHNSTDVSGNDAWLWLSYFVSTLTDTTTQTDSVKSAIAKVYFSSTITLSEATLSIFLQAKRTVTDLVTFTENIDIRSQLNKTLTDVITHAETLRKNFSFTMLEFLRPITSIFLATEDENYLTHEDGENIVVDQKYLTPFIETLTYKRMPWFRRVGSTFYQKIVDLWYIK